MMSYKVVLDNIAEKVKQIILTSGEGLEIDTEDFGWENYRYLSLYFRMAHIERYSDKNLEVLHITTFPHQDSSNPIFGFDIITTDKKPLAAFLDYSPVFSDISYKTDIVFENQYKLPEWANNIFSKSAIAIIPTEQDLISLSSIVEDAYQKYINLCIDYKPIPYPYKNLVKDKQNYYCDQQQKNERTYNVLKAKLGEKRAKIFMSEILFPKIW
jgi:phycocyanobilin:ferredoxin oxidoreductase